MGVTLALFESFSLTYRREHGDLGSVGTALLGDLLHVPGEVVEQMVDDVGREDLDSGRLSRLPATSGERSDELV